jgi:flagellar biosynthesis/type III secretory pathway protein FliH
MPLANSIIATEFHSTTDVAKNASLSSTEIEEAIHNSKFIRQLTDQNKLEIIIDEAMSPGVKIRSKDLSVDATLDTMLRNSLEKILKN